MTCTAAPVSAESFGAGSIGVRSDLAGNGATGRLDVRKRNRSSLTLHLHQPISGPILTFASHFRGRFCEC